MNSRTYVYLKSLQTNKLKPENVLLFGKNTEIEKKIQYLGINYNKVKSNSVNSSLVFEKLNNLCKKRFNVFSGKAGEIVDKIFCQNFNLLHIHPGDLPSLRGSTTIYYSLLKKKLVITSFLIREKLDSGIIILKKRYKLNYKKAESIDSYYDSKLRSEHLINTIKYLNKKTPIIRESKEKVYNYGENVFFVIHPVLKNLVIKKLNER